MNTKHKIFVFIIVLLLLFGGSPSIIKEANLFEAENEAYAIAGLLSVMPTSDDPEPEPVEKCNCNNGIIKPDGRVEMKCPCADGNAKCGCKYSKQGQEPPVITKEEMYSNWYVTKITASWCGACKTWNTKERHKLESMGIKVKDVASSGKYKVSTIPRFWIRKKVGEIDSVENGETDDLILNKYGYSKGQDLVGVINKLQRSVATQEVSGHPFYVRQSTRIWTLNKETHPSKRTLISHFRNHKQHTEFRDWPLEDLSEEELQWIHWDHHNNKLGKLQWK
jgi:hypothetical protein